MSPRCAAAWAALITLAALDCFADDSSCQGSCDASRPLAEFEADETSLLQLHDQVHRRGAKNENDEMVAGSATVAIGKDSIQGKAQTQAQVQPQAPHQAQPQPPAQLPSKAAPKLPAVLASATVDVAARLPTRPAVSLPSRVPSLLSLMSSLSAHGSHAQGSASRVANWQLLNGESVFASATQTHMLAYVVLLGIVMVLLGCGLIIVVSVKNEKRDEDSYEDQQYTQDNRPDSKSPSAKLLPGPRSPPRLSGPRPPHQSASPNLMSMRGNPISPNADTSAAPGSGQLCPELGGATVPERSKFPMKVPMLLHEATQDEYALDRSILTKDDTPMFIMKVTHSNTLPGQSSAGAGCLPQEYLSLCLPDEEQRELVMCAIGRPTAQLECHIYKLGNQPWGFIKGPDVPGEDSYTLILRNGKPALTATVQGTDANRTVRVVQSANRDVNVAVANARLDGPGHPFYEVECYPLCDIILTIIMLTGVDRMSENAHRRRSY